MPVLGTLESSLRVERREVSRLAWAFIISILLHSLIFGGYHAGKQLGWWQRIHMPAWLRSPRMLTEILKQQKAQQVPKQEEVPLVFVEVNQEQASPEPPKEAKFYSNKDSVAANKEADKETTVPKIEGKRPESVKTEDVPKDKFVPLQPVPPAPKAEEKQEEAKALTTYKPGDLTMAKPDLTPKKDEGKEKQSRPQTVKEAKARKDANQLAGQKMKLDGGVSLHRSSDSVDAKATPFGDYDWELVAAVQRAWYAELDNQQYASDYRGKVVIEFSLHHDGRISGLKIVENVAGPMPGLICETAIEKPNPYSAFPTAMRRVVGDTRNIRFTFFYD